MDTRLGYISLPFEVDGAEIPQGRVSACRIVKSLDIIEHIGSGPISRPVDLPPDPPGLREKKLSIAALSFIKRWNCSLVYWLPWSEWCSRVSAYHGARSP